jgi:hypothetical protein
MMSEMAVMIDSLMLMANGCGGNIASRISLSLSIASSEEFRNVPKADADRSIKGTIVRMPLNASPDARKRMYLQSFLEIERM